MLLFPSIVPTTSPELPLQNPLSRATGLPTVAGDGLGWVQVSRRKTRTEEIRHCARQLSPHPLPW
jgi:hypothetical protein